MATPEVYDFGAAIYGSRSARGVWAFTLTLREWTNIDESDAAGELDLA